MNDYGAGAVEALLRLLLWLAVIFVPLGLWKLFEFVTSVTVTFSID